MIRSLDEIRRQRAEQQIPKTKGILQVTLTAVSQVDDLWVFDCNGDAIGEECPHDTWEPGDTSNLEDTVDQMKAHVIAHKTTYHPAPDFRSGLEDEAGADQ